MIPNQLTTNLRNKTRANFINGCYFFMKHISFEKFPNSSYFSSIKFCKGMFGSLSIKRTTDYCILHIPRIINPFKILCSVVFPVSVNMINLREVTRINDKSQSDQSMRKILNTFSIFGQSRHPVATSIVVLGKKLSFSFLSSLSRVAPNLSIFRYRIQSLVSRYVFHYINSLTCSRFASRNRLESAKLIMRNCTII